MTEKEKMIKGMLYDASDDELAAMRQKAHNLCTDYNGTYEQDKEKRQAIIKELFPASGKFFLQGPIQFDYGVFTEFGEGCYANFNLTVLDCCPVKIGKNVFFGPNCSLVTPVHPLVPEERIGSVDENGRFTCLEYAKPIEIGDNCWLASNVTVCGGVKIGEGCVIGAGSVVTRDIPPNSLAAGVPCRVIREITEEDRMFNK